MERRLDSRRGAVVPKVKVAPPQLEKFWVGSTLDELASCDHKDSIRGHDGGQPEQDSGDKNVAAYDDAEMQKADSVASVQELLIRCTNFKLFALILAIAS